MNARFCGQASWARVVVVVSAVASAACSSPTDMDAGQDAATDSPLGCGDRTINCDAWVPDVIQDAGSDVAMDVPTDAPVADTGVDAPSVDSGVDAPSVDTGVDATADAGQDAGSTDGGVAALCTSTGGTITTGLCCASSGDFPSSCSTGACGCSPTSSHNVMKCQCATGMCFDPTLGCH